MLRKKKRRGNGKFPHGAGLGHQSPVDIGTRLDYKHGLWLANVVRQTRQKRCEAERTQINEPRQAMRTSVVIITRNRADFIGEAFEALTQQECPDFEILVVDSSTGADREKTEKLATISGEATVEVQTTNQQLRTPYAQKGAEHTQGGAEISRDEVPVALQPYVQQYFEQVRKQPAVKK